MDLETGGKEFCDSLCYSADVIIARTDAMIHQTHTELPAVPHSLNTCDVTAPSTHHTVEVVPIISFETGRKFYFYKDVTKKCVGQKVVIGRFYM